MTMASQTVTVVVRLKAKPGKEAQVRLELLSLLASTRAEQGYINFVMHEARTIRHCCYSMRIGRARTTSRDSSKPRISDVGSSWPKRCWQNRWN